MTRELKALVVFGRFCANPDLFLAVNQMENRGNGIASDLIKIAEAMGFDPKNAEDMAEFIKVYNENVMAKHNGGAKPSSEFSAEHPRARIDAAHQPEPHAPIGRNLSREARKKFNRDRKKALEKRKRT